MVNVDGFDDVVELLEPVTTFIDRFKLGHKPHVLGQFFVINGRYSCPCAQ